MADVKWIKIASDIFDDEKILLIENTPDKDSIITIWFKLLTLAGKQNNSGVFMIGNKIPYTVEMFATIFRREEKLVCRAFEVFLEYGMIEKNNGVFSITNWGKHQSLDQMERNNEYMKNYMKKYREKQKKLSSANSKLNSKPNSKLNVNGADKNREEKIREEKIREEDNKKPIRHKYGEYENVYLSDSELEKLKEEFPLDWSERIDNLSSYIASTGKTYKNHLATIRNWAKKEKPQQQTPKKNSPSSGNPFLDLAIEENLFQG